MFHIASRMRYRKEKNRESGSYRPSDALTFFPGMADTFSWLKEGCCHARIVPVLSSRVLAIGACLLLLTSTPAEAVQFCNTNGGAGWAIPDNDPTPTTATVTVAMGTAVGPIQDVNITTNITHTYVGDLYAAARSPSAASAVLFDRPGVPAATFGCNGANLQVLFDDEAGTATTIENLCGGGNPSISGTYLPNTTLTAMDGGTVNGIWNIDVTDNAAADTGTIDNVCVDVQAAAITLIRYVSTFANCSDQLASLTVPSGTNVYYCYTVTNSGSYAFTIDSGGTADDLGADISGLEGSYAVGASVTVTSGPYVAGGSALPVGTTGYTAQVTASGVATGLPLTPTAAASVTVLAAPVAAAGNKPLYLTGSTGLSRTKPTTTTQTTINGANALQKWTLQPTLAKKLDFTNASIPVVLRLSRNNGGTTRNFTLQLATAGGTPAGPIGTLSVTNYTLTTTATEYAFSIPVNAGFNSLSLASDITLTLTNTTGAANRRILVDDTNTTTSYSQLSLDATTVINVGSVATYSAAYNGGAAISSIAPGATIYIRGTISDPFGDYDVTSAQFDIRDNLGVLQSTVVQTVPVTELPSNDPALAIFEYAYPVPVTGLGNWTVSVTGFEGSEGTVSHSWSTSFVVGIPNVTVLKSAATPRTVNTLVNSGENITYTLLISNSGTGYASSVTISEAISVFLKFCTNCQAGQAFSFTDGSPVSGLSLGTPTYTDRLAAPYIPAAGYDANVGGVALPMTGFMAPGTSFTLIYQAQTQ